MAQNEKRKKLHGKWGISLEQNVEHKPLFSEEWCTILFKTRLSEKHLFRGNSRVTSSGTVPSKINRLSHENFDIIFYLVKYQKVNFPAAISDVHLKLEESDGWLKDTGHFAMYI